MRFPWRPTHRYVRGIGVLPLILGAATLLSASSIVPYGVNDSGVIVGEYFNGTSPVAVVYNPITSSYTYSNYPGATGSEFIGINDAGQISGSYTTTTGNFGFSLSSGTYTPINVPGAVQSTEGNSSYILNAGGGTEVTGINNSGVIVGTWLSTSADDAFLYGGGAFTNTNIAYPLAVYTSLRAISDSGIAVGGAIFSSSGNETQTDFLYNTNTSTFTTISYPGATNTHIEGINDSGEVVGYFNLSGGLGQPGTTGFTYQNGVFTTVMVPGSDSTELFGISNNGEITGVYTCASGPCASDPAFFATPTANGYSFSTLPTPTPEPGSSFLLGLGLVAFLTVAWRRGRRRGAESLSACAINVKIQS